MKNQLYFFTILICLFTFFSPFCVFAQEKISIQNVSVVDQSDGIIMDSFDIVDNVVSSSLSFEHLNDYVTFDITIKNDSDVEYSLLDISTSFEGNYLAVQSDDIGSTIKKNQSKKFQVRLVYENELLNHDDIIFDDGSFQFNFVEVTSAINPKTGMKYFVIICLVGIFLLNFHFIQKGKKMISFLIFLLVPMIVFALDKKSLVITFEHITVKGRYETYQVVLNNDGILVDSYPKVYGETIESLPVVSKDGYTFDGWIDDNGNRVESGTVVSKDLFLSAKYIPIVYTITYNLNGGALSSSNPETLL